MNTMTREDIKSMFGYTDCAEEVMAAIDYVYDYFEEKEAEKLTLFSCPECGLERRVYNENSNMSCGMCSAEKGYTIKMEKIKKC